MTTTILPSYEANKNGKNDVGKSKPVLPTASGANNMNDFGESKPIPPSTIEATKIVPKVSASLSSANIYLASLPFTEDVKQNILANCSPMSSSNMRQNQDLLFKDCPNYVFSTESFGQYYTHKSMSSYQRQSLISNKYPNFVFGTHPFEQYYIKNWPNQLVKKVHTLMHTSATDATKEAKCDVEDEKKHLPSAIDKR